MKKLKFCDLLAMGLGTTIGAGVFTLTVVAMGYTGGSTFLAYLAGSAIIVFCMLPIIIAGSIVPRRGIFYVLSKETFSNKVAGVHFGIYFVGRITIATNATAFAMYFTSVFTNVNPKLAGIAVVLFFFVSNYFGVSSAVKVQKVMNAVLVIALLLFVAVGLLNMDADLVFHEDRLFVGGPAGFFSAISLLVFSLSGGMSILNYGDMCENPQRDLPKACFAIAATVAVLFAAVALATAGALPAVPASQGGTAMEGTLFFGGMNKAVINAAEQNMHNKALLYFFLLGGACVALTTSINSGFSNYSAACVRAAEDGWLPRFLMKENRYGTPVYMHLVFVLFAALPVLLAPDITALNATLVKVGSGLQVLCNLFPNLALLSMKKLHPAEWEASVFHMSDTMVKLVTIVPTAATVALVYFNFRTYTPTVLTIVLCVCLASVVYAFVGDWRIQRLNGKRS